VLAGPGPQFLGDLPEPVELTHLSAALSGADVLLEAYVRVP
jgi:hypothetical protein